MPKRLQLIGKVFGRWQVLEYKGITKYGSSKWLCKCSCGVKRIVGSPRLIAGLSKSCSCLQKEIVSKRSLKDLTGKKFNRFLVLRREGYDSSKHITWLCKCDCGNYKVVTGLSLKSQNTKSCGCLNREVASKNTMLRNLKGEFGTISKSGTTFLNKIEQTFNVEIEREYILKNRLFDGRINNILLETNGSYWHSLPHIKKNDKIKEKLALQKGFKIFSFENIDSYQDKNINSYMNIYKHEISEIFREEKII